MDKDQEVSLIKIENPLSNPFDLYANPLAVSDYPLLLSVASFGSSIPSVSDGMFTEARQRPFAARSNSLV